MGISDSYYIIEPHCIFGIFLDCWFSAETISIAIPRASQTDDSIIMLSAFLYLSRTVWYAYAAMCLTAMLLKRFHREHSFIEIDPTIVAIFTTFFGPAIAYASCNLGFMLELYFSFHSVVQSKNLRQQNDGAMPYFAYSVIISSGVIIYGFVGGLCGKHSVNFSDLMSSVCYSGVKTKAVFLAMKFVPPYHMTNIPEFGCSIYRLNTVFR
ncbi:hypothetical protein THRCLA_21411 [Thraustotheca clavata]|uniref:Uncharacterized protein n=1 Tax=Thraustotheca clavata TaxID=74557 RepID=A0A1V9ZXF8_9STRA|nr:hypothetical protein THRCLA_21411 [Thraustotheca clavata]